MGLRVIRVFLAVAALALALAGQASAFTKTPFARQMDDEVTLVGDLYTPDGTPPAAGRPAVMMFHGLGGTHADMDTLAETFFVPQGYAVMTMDARGHGASGGLFSLDGPREVADYKALFDWYAAQPGIDGKHIGAYGISLGGGAVWNATVAGVPFAAIVPVITWTDLSTALFPQDLSKSGVIYFLSQSVPSARTDPLIESQKQNIMASANLGAIRALTESRSPLSKLSGVAVPTLMMQGRRDFLFDMTQAEQGFLRLAGPKRLYLGDMGHAPSDFSTAPDLTYFMTEARRWFDRFLKGEPNGIDKGPQVEVAHNRWDGKTTSYAGLPPTRKLGFSFAGGSLAGSFGKLVRSARLAGKQEVFGSPVVTVTASSKTGWSHLVAVLRAVGPSGFDAIVSEGGAATSFSSAPTTVRLTLLSQGVAIPKGSRLELTLASSSTVQSSSNLLYTNVVPESSALSVTKVALTVPVLKQPISP